MIKCSTSTSFNALEQKRIISVSHTQTLVLAICGNVGEMRDAEMNRENMIKKGKKRLQEG